MNKLIRNLNTLSTLQCNFKQRSSFELSKTTVQLNEIEECIHSEEELLNNSFQEIRSKRKHQQYFTSDSYLQEYNNISMIQNQISALEDEKIELLEKKRLQTKQVVKEMNREKLYFNLAKNKTNIIRKQMTTKDDNQLIEQWLANNYNND